MRRILRIGIDVLFLVITLDTIWGIHVAIVAKKIYGFSK